MLTDHSTNGVYVNGERVQRSRLLARADVIRVGSEEFRFYADVAPIVKPAEPMPPKAPAPEPPAPAVWEAPTQPTMPPAADRPAPAPLAEEPPTLPAQPPAPKPAAPAPEPPQPVAPVLEPAAPAPVDHRPVLATLEMLNEGIAKGVRIEIREALTHIGRGEHNDVVLAQDSVSDTHAKLQRREGGWYLVDAGSTNGTFVGGTKISGERRLDGSPDLRFGGVKVRFHPAAGTADAGSGTRQVSAVARPRAQSAPTPAAPAASRGVPAWVWILLALVVVAGAVFLFTKG